MTTNQIDLPGTTPRDEEASAEPDPTTEPFIESYGLDGGHAGGCG